MNKKLISAPGGLPPFELIAGKTSGMQRMLAKLERVATTDISILLQGESGTGKDIVGCLLHASSRRAKGPLVKLSCPAIPQGLFETELFGYERGAFTGALSTKRGRVEQADHGTLFLDEVGSLDLVSQSKLLQVLEHGTFARVGAREVRSISTRLISTANENLRHKVADGTFRLDFLFRINAVTVSLPPLRERAVDIPHLAAHFLEQNSRDFDVPKKTLSSFALRRMQSYNWPGNIRQLENMMRSYALLGSEESLLAELTNSGQSPAAAIELDLSQPTSLKNITKDATRRMEQQIILKVLEANQWNRQKTAQWLQISYRSLLYKLADMDAVDGFSPSIKQRDQNPQTGADPSLGHNRHAPHNLSVRKNDK